MAAVYASYEGRTLTFEVSQGSGTYINWTFTVGGGSSTWYSTGPVYLYINNVKVASYSFSSGRPNGDNPQVFPAAPGSTSGSYNVGGYGTYSFSMYVGDLYIVLNKTFSSTITTVVPTGSFNLNIIDPNGSEPYETGAAGSVEFFPNDKNEYERVHNELASSYPIGTQFKLRNFTPGTGMKFSSISGVSGGEGSTAKPWTASQGSNTIIDIKTAWLTYSVKYNGNGATSGSMSNSSHTYNTAKALTSNAYSRTGYTFAGWNTKADGSGTNYSNGQSVKNLTTTNGATVELFAKWTINKYKLDVNGKLDGGSVVGDLGAYGVFDITVGGTKVGTGVKDYCQTLNYNTSYSITNIKANNGYQYDGVDSGTISGNVPAKDSSVVLKFSTTKPSNLKINAAADGPFKINTSWSSTGINITNYKLYINGQNVYSGILNSYTYTCQPETEYSIYFTATNAGGTVTSSTIKVTTPSDQAKLFINEEGIWKKGKGYIKVNGQWKKAKKIYIKKEGRWVLTKNN